eukprot:scaffold781_cov132-Cylindrotheca_fusiformis.AAC.10
MSITMDTARTDLINRAIDIMLGDLDSFHESTTRPVSPQDEDETGEISPELMTKEVMDLLHVARERRLRKTVKDSFCDPFDLDSLEGSPLMHSLEEDEDDGSDSEDSEDEEYEIPLNDAVSILESCPSNTRQEHR